MYIYQIRRKTVVSYCGSRNSDNVSLTHGNVQFKENRSWNETLFT